MCDTSVPCPALTLTTTQRNSKSTIRGESRKIIANITECCDAEKTRRHLFFPLGQSLKRASAYTGISISTVRKIKAFIRKHPGEAPRTPGKKRRRLSGKIEIDDLNKRVIRDTIGELYTVQKVMPSVRKLTTLLQERIGWRWCSSSLRKLLRSMGFVWRKVQIKRSLLIDRASVVHQRSQFIVQMKHFREVGTEIFYLDESWIDSNLTCGKCWQNTDLARVKTSGNAPRRLMIGSVGSKKGFIKDVQLMFQGDYRGQMNSIIFEKWFETIVLPNLPPKSVIVMVSAPHHNRQVDETPSPYDTKLRMIEWLKRRGVPCDDSMRKETLYSLIRANKPSQKRYVVDAMAAVKGHTVVRLPPYNCDLNAVELSWMKIKRHVSEYKVTGEISDASLLKLAIDSFRTVTAEDWVGYCAMMQELEEEYWRRDGAIENAIDDIINKCTSDISDDESDESLTDDGDSSESD